VNAHERPISSANAGRFVVDTEPYLSCEDCFDLMDQFVETVLAESLPAGSSRPMDVVTLGSLRAHLAGCPACAAETAALLELVAADCGADAGPVRRTLHV
jgi:hypothetical protein